MFGQRKIVHILERLSKGIYSKVEVFLVSKSFSVDKLVLSMIHCFTFQFIAKQGNQKTTIHFLAGLENLAKQRTINVWY